MRKGLTLIELILSMVIIGVVFTVIPRLVMSMNQGEKTTIQEEALYNALAYAGKIIYLPWDQNNTDSDGILTTSGAADYDCNEGYRIGGFAGGRRCDDANRSASAISHDDTDDFNDIDDYDQNTTTPTIRCGGTLKTIGKAIGADIRYVSDPGSAAAFQLSGAAAPGTTNTKMVDVTIGDCSVFRYHSFNIGRIGFDHREWE